LIENVENTGLAAALNQGFAVAAQAGCEWAIAFDQDSTPETGFASALLCTAAANPLTSAVTGANWHDETRPDRPSRHVRRNRRFPLFFERVAAMQDLANITCVITSGTLFHVPTVRALGGFDEALFLDLVDTGMCLRVRAAGHAIRVSAAARLTHRRGAKRPVRFAGRIWWPAFMPEMRLFYLFRNRVRLIGRHGLRFPHWMFYELVYAAKLVADILFLEDRKTAKLSACLRGTWHGMLGRAGKMT
jgi:rhamnosyltransferase